MTLKDVATMLNGITGFAGKVTYRYWEQGKAPALPYICYYSPGVETFGADDKVYHSITDATIELYSRRKDTTSEALIEATLDAANLYYTKTETFIESEKAELVTYEIEVE